MAVIKFSPLITGASGRAGDAIFSSWKGRAYVRQAVTPANPNTSAQQIVRQSMARLPAMFRNIESQLRTFLNAYAAKYSLSAWNWFASQNRKLEETYACGNFAPFNPLIDGALTFVATDNTGGVIKCTWTGGTTGATYKAYILTRKVTVAEIDTSWTVDSKDAVLFSAGTVNLTKVAGKKYAVALLNEETVTHKFSLSKLSIIQLA